MKYKTTNKAVKAGHSFIITTGGAALQTLLSCETAVAYGAGSYGWNYDVYDFYNVAIVSGDRTFKADYHACYELCCKYESLARELVNKIYDFKELKSALNELIQKFIQECKDNA